MFGDDWASTSLRVVTSSARASVCGCASRHVSMQPFCGDATTSYRQPGIAPGAARRYPPAPAGGSSTVAKIAADLRPSADRSTVHTSLVAGGG